MRVLVTGGSGFIGSQVTQALAEAGHEPVTFDVLHPAAHRSGTAASPPDILGDIRNESDVEGALRGCAAVVHQAAMVGMGVDLNDLPEYVSCNDLGTAVLLRAMARAGIGRLVLASSMVVYGEGAYACPDHGPARPAPRAVADLVAGRFDPRCPDCGLPLSWATVPETAPLEPRSGAYAPPPLRQSNSGMPIALALSARLSVTPEPGNTTMPIGSASRS